MAMLYSEINKLHHILIGRRIIFYLHICDDTVKIAPTLKMLSRLHFKDFLKANTD